MTALLAFFIVLNSMAEEQTGANLYSGTGSFNSALKSGGLPGAFQGDHSRLMRQENAIAPMYMVPDPEENEAGSSSGPDKTDDGGRIIDWEEEQFSRFLEELRRVSPPRRQSRIEGEVSLDIMAPLSEEKPLMVPELKKALFEVRSMLSQPDRTMQITVWATTPSQSAWTRAVEQAQKIRAEAIRMLKLDGPQQLRITAVGQTWISSKVKRPSVSLVLRKQATPTLNPR